MMFSIPSLGLILGRLMDLMEILLLFSRTVPPCWHPAWSNSFLFAYQHLPFLPAGIMPTYNMCLRRVTALTPLTTVLFLYFLVFLKLLKLSLTSGFSSICLLSTFSLIVSIISVRSGLLAIFLLFLSDSWSSSLSRFGETFAVALDISKAFDRVGHKSLHSELPSYGFYPSLCNFISSFLSARSFSAEVDGYCSKPKPISSGFLQGSVLSPTLFLLFINDLLSIFYCPFHS